MASIYRSDVIRAPVDRVWSVIRDFNALPSWTPFVAESRIEGGDRSDRIGCIRNFKLQDGGIIREQLLMLDDYNRRCTYSILDSPMSVKNYVATLAILPITTASTTFAEWTAEFDCPEQEETALIKGIGDDVFSAAFANLRQQFCTKT